MNLNNNIITPLEKAFAKIEKAQPVKEEELKKMDTNIIAEINTKAHKNRLIKASDIKLTVPKWLIKDLIPEKGLFEMFGASGTFKSFIMLDMLFCIVAGIKYHHKKVRQGKVVYVAGEGSHGLKVRIKALELHYNISLDDLPFYVLPMPSNLMDENEIIKLSNEIKEISNDGVAITVFDTLHRNSAGSDENSANDFADILGNIDRHLLDISNVVGWVHHSGASEEAKKRSRGTTSRYGALDTQVMIERFTNNKRRAKVSCTKQKDAEEFMNILFDLEDIPLGIFETIEEDEEGEAKEVSSLVPVMADISTVIEEKKKPLTLQQQNLLGSLRLSIQKSGIELNEEIKEREGYKEGRGVEASLWLEDALKVIETNGDEDPKKVADAKRKSFKRQKDALIKANKIAEYDGVIWIIEDCELKYFLNKAS